MPIFIIHDGTKDINRVKADSINDLNIPGNCFCIEEITLKANEVVVFESNERLIKPDYRNVVYYNEATKEKKYITEIGVKPDPSWVEWSTCFDNWLENTVKPERDNILAEWDKIEFQIIREIGMGFTPKYTQQQVWDYKHAIHLFPDGLTEIVDPLIWPTPPEE